MEAKQIKDLMAAMGRTGIKRLVLKRDGVELELERETQGSAKFTDLGLDPSDENPLRSDMELHRAKAFLRTVSSENELIAMNAKSQPPVVVGLADDFITSPMVGTFYSSPSPDDPGFVKVGDRVEANTIVCIIEAMKVMNEVKAGIKGVVAEVMIESGQPIEFGTKLFRINTD